MKKYKFTISGMTCHACEELITMDLEEAGLPKPTKIDHETGVLEIELEESQLEAAKTAAASNEKYSVTKVEEL